MIVRERDLFPGDVVSWKRAALDLTPHTPTDMGLIIAIAGEQLTWIRLRDGTLLTMFLEELKVFVFFRVDPRDEMHPS